MSPECQSFLLSRARRAIAAHVDGAPLDEVLNIPSEAVTPMGCFVTLFSEGGELRGCIGTFEASRPLWQAVETMAVAAASRDPRFPPLQARELEACTIDISALSAPERCLPDAVRVGEHGLLVEGRGCRGVLLPQVAVERCWDALTFLDQTCRKAGLPASAWREKDIVVSTFTVVLIAENH